MPTNLLHSSHQEVVPLSPPLEFGLALRLSYNQSNSAKEALCEFQGNFYLCHWNTLMLRTVSYHIRSPTILRPPCCEEAEAVLRRPCIGILIENATEIPVDSQHQVPAMRGSHLRCPSQVSLDNCSPTYI